MVGGLTPPFLGSDVQQSQTEATTLQQKGNIRQQGDKTRATHQAQHHRAIHRRHAQMEDCRRVGEGRVIQGRHKGNTEAKQGLNDICNTAEGMQRQNMRQHMGNRGTKQCNPLATRPNRGLQPGWRRHGNTRATQKQSGRQHTGNKQATRSRTQAKRPRGLQNE